MKEIWETEARKLPEFDTPYPAWSFRLGAQTPHSALHPCPVGRTRRGARPAGRAGGVRGPLSRGASVPCSPCPPPPQDPPGGSGSGAALPEELLPSLPLQARHVEPPADEGALTRGRPRGCRFLLPDLGLSPQSPVHRWRRAGRRRRGWPREASELVSGLPALRLHPPCLHRQASGRARRGCSLTVRESGSAAPGRLHSEVEQGRRVCWSGPILMSTQAPHRGSD